MAQFVTNRKARYDYHILEELEAGLVLKAGEAKPIAQSSANINAAWVDFSGDDVLLRNCTIVRRGEKEEQGRPIVLLLHKREIEKWQRLIRTKSCTCVPLSIHQNDRGKIKVTIALAQGKKNHDKRESIKKKDLDRYGV